MAKIQYQEMLSELAYPTGHAVGQRWFFQHLPPGERVRMFPHIREHLRYLDIETTGLSSDDVVTVLTIHDGLQNHTFVRGQNLHAAIPLLQSARILVTYNGTHFDLPFLRREFHIPLRQFHLDLHPILRDRGFTGGLKHVENVLGIQRTDLPDATGCDAIRWWNEYFSGNQQSLTLLCRYNAADAQSLAIILRMLYTESMRGHPFF